METNNTPNQTKETEKNTKKVVELTDELAENHLSEIGLGGDTENRKESEEKPKVEPLPEQKPFILSPYERAILEEMERRATDNQFIAEGLKDKDKNIQECFAFITHRAEKMAEGNCAMIADTEVYNWAQFYYTQRREIIELEFERPKPAPAPTKPAPKTEQKKKEVKKAEPKKPEFKVVKSDTKTAETKEEEEMPSLF